MIINSPTMSLIRSNDPSRVNLKSNFSLSPLSKDVAHGDSTYSLSSNGLNGLGLTVSDIGMAGYLGFAVAGLAAYYLFFKSNAAQKRRAEMRVAKDQYKARVAAIKRSYSRF
jgi:hypothetical protein